MPTTYGTNFDSKVSSTLRGILIDANGLITVAEGEGAAATTANLFAHGATYRRTDSGTGNSSLYENIGSAAVPNWTVVNNGTPQPLLDDDALTFGTVTATPATSVTLSYDKTASGLGKFVIGTNAVPQVVTAAATGVIKVYESAVNATAASAAGLTDLILDYQKLRVTGAGNANLTPVVLRPQLIVGVTGGANNSAISEGYTIQGGLYHAGTGAVTGQLTFISGVIDIGSDNFTAGSGVNGIDLAIQGTATLTGTLNGISVDVKTGCKVGSAFIANCQTTTTSGLTITGSPVSEITLSSGVPVMTGTAVTRAAVEALPGASAAAIGTIFVGTGIVGTTKPNLYVKVTGTTWERIVSQASD